MRELITACRRFTSSSSPATATRARGGRRSVAGGLAGASVTVTWRLLCSSQRSGGGPVDTTTLHAAVAVGEYWKPIHSPRLATVLSISVAVHKRGSFEGHAAIACHKHCAAVGPATLHADTVTTDNTTAKMVTNATSCCGGRVPETNSLTTLGDGMIHFRRYAQAWEAAAQ